MQQNNQPTSLLSFLNQETSVMLVANDKMDNILVTPLVDKTGAPKVDLLGNPIGSIRLEQNSRNMNGTYLNSRRRTAFIGGRLDELESIITNNKLKAGHQLPGRIWIQESLEPMWKGQNPKINPETEVTIGVTVNEIFYPVYARSLYTENKSQPDELIRTPKDVIQWLSANQIQQDAKATTTEEASVPAGSQTDAVDA